MQLSDMNLAEVETLMQELSQPRYRAQQVYSWLTRGTKPSEMLNLPLALRAKLGELSYGAAEIFQKRRSELDGTVKYLFSLDDENLVEGVLMRYHYGNTACISTQVGCRMGCRFCASTLEGCVRNLSAGEMLMEIAAIERDEPQPASDRRAVTNIVLMGSGEPLDNYDNVVRFLKLVSAEEGMNISPRNISLSTCGIVPKMLSFIDDAPHVTLSVSLHAHNDAQRSEIMPINRVYPIHDVVHAARLYADTTGRRVVFEYALIGEFNASLADAEALSRLLRGINCHVNLIPLNPVKERGLNGVTRSEALRFCQKLTDCRISATIRREMGADIEGACGQLRRRVQHDLRS